jgi:hypothetical protein
MRRSLLGVVLVSTVVLAACGERAERSVAPRLGPTLSDVAPACPDSASIISQIHGLFPFPHASPVFAKFDSLLVLLGPVPPGPDTAAAQEGTIQLIGTILTAYNAGALTGGTSSQTQTQIVALVNGLLCISGLPQSFSLSNLGADGAATVFSPTSPSTTLVTGTKFAGIHVDSGSTTHTVLVTITRLPDSPGPLLTQLDQYPLFYEFHVTPAGSSFTLPVVIGACEATSLVPPDPSRLRIAHNVAPFTPGSIEILPLVPAPFLDCTNADVIGLGSANPLANFALAGWRAIRPALSRLVMPERLFAATGGIGGTVKTFSPFGLVDTLAVMTPNSPTSQSGTAGSPVSAPPSVTVKTPTGRAITSLPVNFAVTAGGGSLTGASTATDASGIATVGSWTLGSAAGLNTATATATPPQIGSGVAGSPLTFSATGIAPIVTLVNCPPNQGAGDELSRAFYLPNFPGTSLSQVNLYLSANAHDDDDPAPYTIQLIAKAGGFNGPVIGTSTVTVTLRGDADENKLTQFAFAGTPPVSRSSTVTFQFSVLSNPNRAKLTFNVGSCGLGNTHCTSKCPVVETNDARGTLSAFRRQGCGVTVLGAN